MPPPCYILSWYFLWLIYHDSRIPSPISCSQLPATFNPFINVWSLNFSADVRYITLRGTAFDIWHSFIHIVWRNIFGALRCIFYFPVVINFCSVGKFGYLCAQNKTNKNVLAPVFKSLQYTLQSINCSFARLDFQFSYQQLH